jgi:hypothetical protein
LYSIQKKTHKTLQTNTLTPQKDTLIHY